MRNTTQTIQDAINANAEKVTAWNDAHTESTYTQSKTVLRLLWIFITTSVKIWIRALFKGTMAWKNIGIVLAVSIPLVLLGGLLGAIYAPLGAPLVFLGNFIMIGTVLLLLPRWMIPIILWMVALSFASSSNTTVTTYTTTREYVEDEWGNRTYL